MPGFVPEYEEREAARFGLYNWTQWQFLNTDEKASIIAQRRMSNLIRLHQDDAVHIEMERRSKRANLRPRR